MISKLITILLLLSLLSVVTARRSTSSDDRDVDRRLTGPKISARCGRPGIPPKARLWNVSPERSRFETDETVFVICEEHQFPQHRQSVTCKNGQWIGERPRCGVALNQQVERVDVYDCDSPQTNSRRLISGRRPPNNDLNYRLLISRRPNQTENPFELPPNAYHVTRDGGLPVTVDGSDCYLFVVQLDQPAQVGHLLVDFFSHRNDSRMTKDGANATAIADLVMGSMSVEADVGPHRSCRLVKSTHQRVNEESVTGWYFFCDLRSADDHKLEQKNASRQIKIRVNTTDDNRQPFGLEAVFIGGVYKLSIGQRTSDRPDCGVIEIERPGVMIQKEQNFYLIRCNDSFNEHSDTQTKFTCSPDGQWQGQWPVCTPIITCTGWDSDADSSVYIDELSNVYYVNETHWLMTNDSSVKYRCFDQNHYMIGRRRRSCLKTGDWSNRSPRCTGGGIGTTTIVGILLASLLIVVLVFGLALRWYTRRVKKDLKETRNQIEESVRKRLSGDYDDPQLLNNVYEEPPINGNRCKAIDDYEMISYGSSRPRYEREPSLFVGGNRQPMDNEYLDMLMVDDQNQNKYQNVYNQYVV